MRNLYIYIVAFLLTSACASSYQITEIVSSEQKFTTDYEKEDTLIAHEIIPYREQLESSMNGVIAYAIKDMNKAQPESTLGNLLADATLEIARKNSTKSVDIGIINYGGIRVPSINKGEVTLGNIYEIMPFDNYLVIIELKGSVLQEVCNLIASKGGWPIAGVTFKIKENKAVNVQVGAKALDSSLIYRVAISDYLAGGGDNLAMLKELAFENTNILLRDAFIEYFKNEGQLSSNLENRIEYE